MSGRGMKEYGEVSEEVWSECAEVISERAGCDEVEGLMCMLCTVNLWWPVFPRAG